MAGETLYDQLTRDGGTRIRLDRLATVLMGIFAAAFGEGLADLVSGVIEWWIIKPIEGYGSFVSTLISTISEGLGWVADGVWSPLIELVESFGVLAFPAAILVTLAIAYLIVIGRDWSG